jgi:hypothetical protein
MARHVPENPTPDVTNDGIAETDDARKFDPAVVDPAEIVAAPEKLVANAYVPTPLTATSASPSQLALVPSVVTNLPLFPD